MSEISIVRDRYAKSKAERSKYLPLWQDISKYINPINDVNETFETTSSKGDAKDFYLNDSTAMLSVFQSADYLLGILWGSGTNVFDIVPSRQVEEIADDKESIDSYYQFVTQAVEEQMTHPQAGFYNAAICMLQDQKSYGTSGTGAFPNPAFKKNKAENAIIFKHYGVHNTCVDEGNGGKLDVIFNVNTWRTHRVVKEFAYVEDEFNKELFDKLPYEVKKAYEEKDYNKEFKVINGIMPNSDFMVGKKGKAGTKYKGVWFLENEGDIFYEEYFKELPIAMTRDIQASGHIYGLSASAICLSGIKLTNYLTGSTVEAIDKMHMPTMGTFDHRLDAIDMSGGNIVVLPPSASNAPTGGTPPLFPLSEVQDISAMVSFLIPKLQNDIVNAFKIDKLLDFNNQTGMTATETLERSGIRIKSIAPDIIRKSNEWLLPQIKRCISICKYFELLGYRQEELADTPIEKTVSEAQIIPSSVLEAIEKGLPWFDVKFKNDIYKYENAEMYENLSKFLMILGQVIQVKPELAMALKEYNLIEFLQNITNLQNQGLFLNEYELNEIKAAEAEKQQEMMQLQKDTLASQTALNMTGAEKNAAQSQAE